MRIQNKRQKGSTSVVVVIIVLLGAALGYFYLMGGASEKKAATNNQDQILAKQSAELAVSTAKQKLQDNWGMGMTECASTPCSCSANAPCVWSDSVFVGKDFTQQNAAWWTSYATVLTKPKAELAAGPQYIVVNLGCDTVNNTNAFRIVGRGVGTAAATVAFSDITFSLSASSQNATSSVTAEVKGMVNGTEASTFNMAPSTGSAGFWLNQAQCTVAGFSYAQCETNCAGQVRVMAMTKDNNCVKTYGPWSTDTSQVQMMLNAKNYTVACHLTTPPTTCPTAAGKVKVCRGGAATTSGAPATSVESTKAGAATPDGGSGEGDQAVGGEDDETEEDGHADDHHEGGHEGGEE